MIKATGVFLGKPTAFFGLSFENLRRLQARPLDDHILIKGDELGISHDIVLFSGETEAVMETFMTENFTLKRK